MHKDLHQLQLRISRLRRLERLIEGIVDSKFTEDDEKEIRRLISAESPHSLRAFLDACVSRDLNELTYRVLRQRAADRHIPYYGAMNKDELIAALMKEMRDDSRSDDSDNPGLPE